MSIQVHLHMIFRVKHVRAHRTLVAKYEFINFMWYYVPLQFVLCVERFCAYVTNKLFVGLVIFSVIYLREEIQKNDIFYYINICFYDVLKEFGKNIFLASRCVPRT